MQYFIVMQGESMENCMKETNLLGEDNGFGVFWAGSGLEALMNIVQNKPDVLINKPVDIVTDKGEFLNVEQFLDAIQDLKVRLQN